MLSSPLLYVSAAEPEYSGACFERYFSGGFMQRVGFLIKVKPEKLEDYKKHHQQVWPELLAELKKPG